MHSSVAESARVVVSFILGSQKCSSFGKIRVVCCCVQMFLRCRVYGNYLRE